MTILQRIWKATEVERWGIKDWWENSEMRWAVVGLLILASPFILVGIWVYVARGLLQGLVGLLR